uniref:Uncharacterized protein n=1 Tax=Arundo donax TaxID=35708 RepID=A0A0A9H5H9_ARUDO
MLSSDESSLVTAVSSSHFSLSVPALSTISGIWQGPVSSGVAVLSSDFSLSEGILVRLPQNSSSSSAGLILTSVRSTKLSLRKLWNS